MQTLTVAESGFLYIFKCIEYYSSGCFYLLLYAAALAFIFFKGTEKEKAVFLWPGIVTLLTVFNPLTPVVINSIFDINKEYYRFLWIAPVTLVLAYISARFVAQMNTTGERIIAAAGICLILAGSGVYLYSSGYTKAANIYKMPEEVIQVADIIHKDSDHEYPRAVCDYNMNMELRQYDASIMLTVDREAYMNAVAGGITDDMLKYDENPVNRILGVVVMGRQIPKEDFIKAMDDSNTEYIVLDHYSSMQYYLKKAGLKKIGETGTRVIYRYTSKNTEVFTLPDYSEVWKQQKFLSLWQH
ncbi:MAG: hypothetical protein K6F39_01805 [Lachnospiraceae bacterium]|nr:hypothetical protein [Lachnospiraceae bacterium]